MTTATQAQVQELKAELAKARADTAAAVALASEREPPGLGGTVDRLFSSRTPPLQESGLTQEYNLGFSFFRFCCACSTAPPWRITCKPKQGSAQGDRCGVCE